MPHSGCCSSVRRARSCCGRCATLFCTAASVGFWYSGRTYASADMISSAWFSLAVAVGRVRGRGRLVDQLVHRRVAGTCRSCCPRWTATAAAAPPNGVRRLHPAEHDHVVVTRRAAMAVSEDGEVAGSVSGGCVEGAVLEALEVLGRRRPAVTFGIATTTPSPWASLRRQSTCSSNRSTGDGRARHEPLEPRCSASEPVALATVIEGPGRRRQAAGAPGRRRPRLAR